MKKATTYSQNEPKFKVRRKGVHAKTKSSTSKQSKLYQKKYRGQGK